MRSPSAISACSPSPTSQRKVPLRLFQRTASPGFQTGATRVRLRPTRRVFLWLALRGAPTGNLARPDIQVPLRPALYENCGYAKGNAPAEGDFLHSCPSATLVNSIDIR
jgi:hypothetical protein